MIILFNCKFIIAISKPVLVYDNNSQLITSSLLTWESFSHDQNQFKHAVTGGIFTGQDVNNDES